MPVLVDNKEWKDWGGLERIDINVDDPVEVDSTCQFFDHNNSYSWVQYRVDTEIVRREMSMSYGIKFTILRKIIPIFFIRTANTEMMISHGGLTF